MIRYLYFGCANNRKGHYLISLDKYGSLDPKKEGLPWGWEIDSCLCPGKIKWREHWVYAYNGPNEIEGLANLNHKDGWTGLSFWDRSVDSRYASNSNFFVNCIMDWDEMLTECKLAWPDIWNRFKFEIVQYLPPEEGLKRSKYDVS